MMAEQVIDNAVAAPATPTQPAQNPTDGANSGQSNGAKTFTQEQVNEMVGSTRKSARDTAIADMLKELGLTSKEEISSLKTTIADAQKLKQSQMSEIEKAQAERDAIIKERDALNARLTERETFFRQREIRGAVEKAATTQKANDAETVYLWLKEKHADSLNALMGEDGTIDAKALDKLLETVKSEKAVYFTAPVYTPGSQSNANGRVLPSEAEALKRASIMNQRIIRG